MSEAPSWPASVDLGKLNHLCSLSSLLLTSYLILHCRDHTLGALDISLSHSSSTSQEPMDMELPESSWQTCSKMYTYKKLPLQKKNTKLPLLLYISYYVTIPIQGIEFHTWSQVFKISLKTYSLLRTWRALENQNCFGYQMTFSALDFNTLFESQHCFILDCISHHFLTDKCHWYNREKIGQLRFFQEQKEIHHIIFFQVLPNSIGYTNSKWLNFVI